VEQSEEAAVALYRLAAEGGYATAQCNLGRMFELGRGVAVSLADATAWYRKAAEAGNKLAKEALRRLEDPAPETIMPQTRS
jgi:TPR repeat protein